LSFAILLAIRTYLVFWGLPTSRSFLFGSFERIVLSWALVATTLFAIGSLMVARAAGITLGSSARLSGEAIGQWTNANVTGLYCAFGVLICIIARFIPMWIRLTAGGLAFYCLLLSQSRTAIVTIIVSGICGLFVGRKWNWKVAVLAVCALLLALSLVNVDESVDSLQSNPAIASITQRFLQPPGRNGEHARLDVIASGVEAWSRSPLFGSGYEAPDTRFENGYLSLACETGAIGLLLYLVFVGLLSMQIIRMLKTPAGSDTRELGGYLLCVTVFVLVHGIGERTHGFQIGSLVSNVWALLAASALGATLLPQRSVR
jgi:O-antigen ligase